MLQLLDEQIEVRSPLLIADGASVARTLDGGSNVDGRHAPADKTQAEKYTSG
jgi:hypothetical protein